MGCCRFYERWRNSQLGTVTVSNSTFSGNIAAYEGGGIYNFGGTLTVSDSTFSGNSAPLAVVAASQQLWHGDCEQLHLY